MKLLRGFKPIPAFSSGTVATIGNFDGVHRGHQALLKRLKTKALELQLPLVILLFEPQPSEFFRGYQAPARLSSLREKLAVLATCGVDYVYCLQFNKKLAEMSSKHFAKSVIFSLLQVKYLLIGADFRFGNARLGDVQLLKDLAANERCFIETFPDFIEKNQRISSTLIRETLARGELCEAAILLGRSYSLCGRVVTGAGRGRQWGIPTANLAMTRLALPLTGVFCVQVRLSDGAVINGVANLGRRPTIDGTKNVLEIHLFDFNNNLYGEMLHVQFLYKLRDEIKFSSQKELIAQIHNDIAAAKARFSQSCVKFNTMPYARLL